MSTKPPSPPPALRAQILAHAGRLDAPTRASWQRRAMLITGLGVAASLLLFVSIGGVKLGARPSLYVATLGAAWVGLLLAASPWALFRGRSSVGRPNRLLLGLSLSLPVLVLVLVGGAAALWPETRALADNRSDLRCFGFALALGAGPYAAFVAVKHNLVLVHPHVEAGLAGVFAGTLGAFLITLRCECSELSHLLLGHVLPVLLLGGISALLAGWWFARAPLSA